jgi:hypothetical protein
MSQMAYGQQYAAVWTCPFCRWQGAPERISRVTTGGWICFWVVGLATCMLFCWIGLLIRERHTVCPCCNTRIN